MQLGPWRFVALRPVHVCGLRLLRKSARVRLRLLQLDSVTLPAEAVVALLQSIMIIVIAIIIFILTIIINTTAN